MKKVYVEDDKGKLQKYKLDHGVVFGSVGKDLQMAVFGHATFEQMNNILYSGIKHLYESSVKVYGKDKEEAIRDEIYNRAVQMFSLIMDEFYPEAKDKALNEVLPEQE